MASLYKNNGIWYIAVNFNGNRKCKSLKTKDIKVSRPIKPFVETYILQELRGIKESSLDIIFTESVERFLNAKHPWSKATYDLNNHILTSHLHGKSLPTNPTFRAIHIRHINQCWNWGFKNDLVKKAHLIAGDTKIGSRLRTYKECELNTMFTRIKDDRFNSFVPFAYYTGARSGEIRPISKDNVLEDSLCHQNFI